MIFLFNVDSAVVGESTVIQGDAPRMADLGSESASFFVDKKHLVDQAAFFRNELVFDANQYTAADSFYGLLTTLDAPTLATTVDELFTIVDSLKTESLANAEILITDATVVGYVANSGVKSGASTIVELKQSDNTKLTRDMSHWVEFQYDINGTVLTIRAYTKEADFVADYEGSTLGRIFYPIPVATMIEIYEHNTALTVEALQSVDVINAMRLSAESTDNTGVFMCESYFHNSGARITIGVAYKGAVPNIDAVRTYIAEDLVAQGLTTGQWEEILPEIFASNEFFYVPQWTDYLELGETKLYPCILNMSTAIADVKKVFNVYETAFIEANIQSIQASGPDTFLIALPSKFNSVDHMSLLTAYPDYIRDSSPVGLLNYVTDGTRQFMEALAAALVQAKLANAPNQQERFGYSWYAFVHGGITHYIMLESEYLKLKDA